MIRATLALAFTLGTATAQAGEAAAPEPAPPFYTNCSWRAEKALARAKVETWGAQYEHQCWNKETRLEIARLQSSLLDLMDKTQWRVQASLERNGPDLATLRLCWFYGNVIPRALTQSNGGAKVGECAPLINWPEKYSNDEYQREEKRLLAELRARNKAEGR